jgi:biopolymer transport protein ExbB
VIEFLAQSGILLYPLLLCSLIATAITAERMISLRRSRVLPSAVIEVIHAAQPGRDPSIAIEVCRRNPGVFADIIRVALEHTQRPWNVMRDVVLDTGRQKTVLLERHLVWLHTIAQAAPLLGLLGTVLGMIKMFASMSLSGLGDPGALSAGISEAMATTALGLGIGIPTLVAHNLLAAKSEALVVEIESYASDLVTRLRPAGADGGDGVAGGATG